MADKKVLSPPTNPNSARTAGSTTLAPHLPSPVGPRSAASQSFSHSLPLEAKQILPLSKYLCEKSAETLLFSYKNPYQGSNSRTHLCDQIRRELKRGDYHFTFENLQQIRRSVIAIWIKQSNLREAQVKSGHRSINSTERYQLEAVQELIEQVHSYHPLH